MDEYFSTISDDSFDDEKISGVLLEDLTDDEKISDWLLDDLLEEFSDDSNESTIEISVFPFFDIILIYYEYNLYSCNTL